LDLSFFSASRFARLGRGALIGLAATLLVACGGDDDATGAPAVAPAIAQQPADASVAAGQAASFGVTATGSAPLTYRWQRDGADIAGATGPTYALAAAAPGDSGATFHVVVGNAAGSVTSRDAVPTVTAVAAPVLTITAQPTDVAATAGVMATFTVAATCSAGALDVQWQRNSGANGAFAAIAGATAATLPVTPSVADDAAQFRAALDCGGQSATASGVAKLAVSAPASVRVDPLAVTGLRVQGTMAFAGPVAVDPDGSVVFAINNQVKRISADLSSITRLAGSGEATAARDDQRLPAGEGDAALSAEANGRAVLRPPLRIERVRSLVAARQRRPEAQRAVRPNAFHANGIASTAHAPSASPQPSPPSCASIVPASAVPMNAATKVTTMLRESSEPSASRLEMRDVRNGVTA
jgi:hypothetical protein